MLNRFTDTRPMGGTVFLPFPPLFSAHVIRSPFRLLSLPAPSDALFAPTGRGYPPPAGRSHSVSPAPAPHRNRTGKTLRRRMPFLPPADPPMAAHTETGKETRRFCLRPFCSLRHPPAPYAFTCSSYESAADTSGRRIISRDGMHINKGRRARLFRTGPPARSGLSQTVR